MKLRASNVMTRAVAPKGGSAQRRKARGYQEHESLVGAPVERGTAGFEPAGGLRRRLTLPSALRATVLPPLLAALFLSGPSGCRGKEAPAPAATHEHEGHEAGAKAALYQCPMHPSYTSDKPGECPICGMKLVPVGESEPEGETSSNVPGRVTVRISPERQQIIGVKTDVAEVRPLKKTVRAVGNVAYDPELYQAEKEYIESLSSRDKTGGAPGTVGLVESSSIRLRQLGLNDAMIADLARSRKPSLNLLLPEDTMWVYAQVYEYEINWIRVGQSISTTSLAFPGEVFRGILKAIDPVVNPETRTVRIRAEVKNPGRKLKPNTFVNVEIETALGKGLTIPRDAVIDSGDRKIVFVNLGEGKLQPREIRTGIELADHVQVLEGLAKGDKVVTSANFLIDSESSLKAAVKQMGGHTGHGQ
ncbi:MAG: efflux RND transporter periplasmic adaptor subunit [Nitrospirae bacterium]|nr:efflux RND transporter periplasmic adaptor subunit [Nitrospirota bacterium]